MGPAPSVQVANATLDFGCLTELAKSFPRLQNLPARVLSPSEISWRTTYPAYTDVTQPPPWCSFKGVTCGTDVAAGSTYRRVTRIDLSSLGLAGTIPALNCLSEMTTLSLANNTISGIVPPTLIAIPAAGAIETRLNLLTRVDLSHNQLIGTIPIGLSTRPDLAVLNLGSNRLTGTIPSAVGNLAQLTSLSLDNNQLSGTIPQLGITLTTIVLNNNHLTMGSLTSVPRSTFSANAIDINLKNNCLVFRNPVVPSQNADATNCKATPTPSSAPTPTSKPSPAPTATPTSAPTPAPTEQPTKAPTSAPTTTPTSAPTPAPTTTPTSAPTPAPTVKPISAPTPAPTETPFSCPSPEPTETPFSCPSPEPTATPTKSPLRKCPVAPSTEPSSAPTATPTKLPTRKRSAAPSNKPSSAPTAMPTKLPTRKRSAAPSNKPSSAPTEAPTKQSKKPKR